MSKVDKTFIDDIFGIPQDGSNIGDDDSESYSGRESKATIPFEEKVAELNKDIQAGVTSAPEKVVEKEQPKKESSPTQTKKEAAETVAKSAIPANPTSPSSMFGDIFGEEETKPTVVAKVETKVETVETPKVEKVEPKVEKPKPIEPPKAVEVKAESAPAPTIPQKTDDLGTKAQSQPSQPSVPLIIAGKAAKNRWLVDAPSPKYNSFYDSKRESLEGVLLKGGELPFDQYFEELEGASVDVSVGEQFNAELVCQKMSQCQQHRERIKQIQLRVNRQFFQWERHMDLFAGLLARIEDTRGVEKRDGIRYEHMYDMEAYFGELKSLHKSIDNVMRVLDSAFECLSRQVTVTLPIKDVERYSKGPTPYSPAMGKFDGLKTQANSGSSMASAKPKEAGTPAEPNTPKSGWDL